MVARPMAEIDRYLEDSRGAGQPPLLIPVLICDCGAEVVCANPLSNDCMRCGADYNGSGQKLAPPDFWAGDF